MRLAYLIDRDSIGGGMEYVRRRIAANPGNESRVFFSDRGECTVAKVNAWGAEKIVVNHLKALLQLLGNPFRRPHGEVTFVVHGIHLRKYEWKMREGGAAGIRALPSYWLRPDERTDPLAVLERTKNPRSPICQSCAVLRKPKSKSSLMRMRSNPI